MSNIPISDIRQHFFFRSLETQRRALYLALRNARVTSGLTQTEVAIQLKLPQSFVSKYESGQRRLDLIEIAAVCGAIKITVPKLMALWEMQLQMDDNR